MVNIGKIFITIFQTWWRAVRQIPQILKRFGVWLYNETVELVKVVGKALKFIFIRNYLILFVFGVTIFFVLYYINKWNFEISIALSSLVCGVAIVKPILDWRDHFGEDISSARMYLYKTAQKTRRVFQYNKLTRCPNCNRPNAIGNDTCWNCNEQLPKCMICNSKIERGTQIAKCLICERIISRSFCNIFHPNHLETWLRFNAKCPVCKDPIKVKKEEFNPISTYEEVKE